MARAPASLFSLVTKGAKGDAASITTVQQALEGVSSPTVTLVEQSVVHAGTKAQQELLRAQRTDFPWCMHMRPELQEFRTVFPDEDVSFETGIRGALSSAAWGYEHARALKAKGPARVTAAKKLLKDMNAVAAEAAGYVEQIKTLRSRITPALHALQVLTLMRAEAAVPSWVGKRVLEVGPQDGGLFAHLRAQGVDVWALDLEPRFKDPRVITGDFMTQAVPGTFDVVLATAVFEFGSGWEHIPEVGIDDVRLLKRLHPLLNPGGVVVMENVGCPIPFSARAAQANGFDVVDTRTLVHNLAETGRGCTIRRR